MNARGNISARSCKRHVADLDAPMREHAVPPSIRRMHCPWWLGCSKPGCKPRKNPEIYGSRVFVI